MKPFITVIFFIVAFSATAQHNHSDHEGEKTYKEPPHGGELLIAGKYTLEVVKNPMQKEEKLILYVLKKNYKQVELKDASAKIVMKYKDGKTDSLSMEIQSGRFTAESIDLTKSMNIFFWVQVGKNRVTATYFNEGLIK